MPSAKFVQLRAFIDVTSFPPTSSKYPPRLGHGASSDSHLRLSREFILSKSYAVQAQSRLDRRFTSFIDGSYGRVAVVGLDVHGDLHRFDRHRSVTFSMEKHIGDILD